MGISIKKILKSFSLGGYDDTVKICIRRIQNGKQTSIFTPNSEMVSRAARSEDLLKILNSADILFPDGIGIHMGMKLLSIPVSERTTGIDLAERLIREAAKGNHKIFLLGSKDGVSSRAASNINEKYSSHIICGYHHGYFDKYGEENKNVIQMINASGADILFVCFGFPEQEKWIAENLPSLRTVKLAIGLGGSLDVWSGDIKRAPRFVSNSGLEWLWRLCLDLKRLKRISFLVDFALLVLKESFIKAQDFGKCYEIDNFLK
jgi:N-acetylglucosaminyldiphosphoundecaprenol N-acetyl-beta-D-mannosaminyltransferase